MQKLLNNPAGLSQIERAQIYHHAARKLEAYRSRCGAVAANDIRSRFLTPGRNHIADIPLQEIPNFLDAMKTRRQA